ncbi:MAG: aspartate/glutamate racemase family protein [Alphaproteobacteria bacterium]
MTKKVALFHTSIATVEIMKSLLAQKCPQVEVIHIIEESMIKDVMQSKEITTAIQARITHYVQAAEAAGCHIFMTACSSIGKVVEDCQSLTSMKLGRIDTAMIEEALDIGGCISVLATVETTLKPTMEYIQRLAKAKGGDIQIDSHLIPHAFEALLAGDISKHNQLVQKTLQNVLAHSDVVVLAQASMAQAVSSELTSNIPLLTSPELGISQLAEMAK